MSVPHEKRMDTIKTSVSCSEKQRAGDLAADLGLSLAVFIRQAIEQFGQKHGVVIFERPPEE